eukprot:TRINITY_DN95027_c0_g1_i1.p1 TRINITY_DN95027_c0_g1~~TRINITY_DN95027_c0_g1_i1.p1  ORF type:complete len:544 (+),score=88.34 TRINITY_DN95027_c0_g1_i1:71-1702(+)
MAYEACNIRVRSPSSSSISSRTKLNHSSSAVEGRPQRLQVLPKRASTATTLPHLSSLQEREEEWLELPPKPLLSQFKEFHQKQQTPQCFSSPSGKHSRQQLRKQQLFSALELKERNPKLRPQSASTGRSSKAALPTLLSRNLSGESTRLPSAASSRQTSARSGSAGRSHQGNRRGGSGFLESPKSSSSRPSSSARSRSAMTLERRQQTRTDTLASLTHQPDPKGSAPTSRALDYKSLVAAAKVPRPEGHPGSDIGSCAKFRSISTAAFFSDTVWNSVKKRGSQQLMDQQIALNLSPFSDERPPLTWLDIDATASRGTLNSARSDVAVAGTPTSGQVMLLNECYAEVKAGGMGPALSSWLSVKLENGEAPSILDLESCMAFSEYDENGDGKLSCLEMGTMLREHGLDVSYADTQKAIEMVAGPGESTVSIESYLELVHKRVEANRGYREDEMKLLKQVFDAYDRNNSERLDPFEISDLLRDLGCPVKSPDDSQELRAKLCVCCKEGVPGPLSFDEFVHLARLIDDAEKHASEEGIITKPDRCIV